MNKRYIIQHIKPYKWIQILPKNNMEEILKKADQSTEKIQNLLFSIRKFLEKNPDVAKRYKEFLKEKEPLIY